MGLLLCSAAAAGESPPGKTGEPARAAKPEATAGDSLSADQARVADKYARLEQLMIRMAEIEATSNPERSALLKRAVQQSSERLTRQQLAAIVRLLVPPAQLQRAIDEQGAVVVDLKALLELLLSENRADRLKDEQARLREYIREVERLLRLQRGLQGRTEGGEEPAKLAPEQGKVADRTTELAQRIQQNEEPQAGQPGRAKEGSPKDSLQKQKPSETPEKQGSQDSRGKGEKDRPGGSSPKDRSESGEPTPADANDRSSQPKDSNTPSGPSQPGGPKQENTPPSEPQAPQQNDQTPKENPARKRLQAAEERMRAAQKKLDEAKQKDAVKEQEEARRELEKAKADLEEILRQLREEELERTLALLEGRFRHMLEVQVRIYESTKRLDATPAQERGREVDIQASKLGFDENKLVVEADRALLLLREEGSSVAFPETVEQMRDDMLQAANRLADGKVDSVTQGYEEDVIAALEEMIDALQKAQQQQEQQRQQPMQPLDSNPEMPLVDQLSELKMIRALQVRVNQRTQRYARLLKDIDDPIGQAEGDELQQALQKLSEKQQRIYEVTRDVVLGKNR